MKVARAAMPASFGLSFMMLNPLGNTRATRAAVAQAISVLRDALDSA